MSNLLRFLFTHYIQKVFYVTRNENINISCALTNPITKKHINEERLVNQRWFNDELREFV